MPLRRLARFSEQPFPQTAPSGPDTVVLVIGTHHHGDHAYGNSIWTDAGATTLAYKGVAEEMKRNEPASWQDSAKQRQDVRELNRTGPEPPSPLT